MNFASEVLELQKILKKKGSKKRARKEKEYLKSPLSHYGVSVPDLRSLAKSWIKEHPDISVNELIDFCFQLWRSEWHEERSLAVFLLSLRAEELDHGHISFLEEMVSQATTWAHLDEIAINLVGEIVRTDRSTLLHILIWSQSPNFWVRRAAILSQLKLFREGKGNMTVFREIAVSQFDEGAFWSKEEKFFIRKAIGWALRERSKNNPDSVVKFVNKYASKMSGLTYKEATRNLSPEHAKLLDSKSIYTYQKASIPIRYCLTSISEVASLNI